MKTNWQRLNPAFDKSFFKLLPVYVIVFFSFFDTHAQMPVLAPYALSLGASPYFLGVVIGTYSLFNIAGNILGGAGIDRHGWRKPLLISLAGVSLFLFVYTLAGNAAYLLAARAGHGFAGGILVPASMASLATSTEQAANSYIPRMSKFGAAIGLAALSGPLAAVFVTARFGYQGFYLFLALLMGTAFLMAILTVQKGVTRPAPGHGSFKAVISAPLLQSAFIFSLGTMGAAGTLASFLPLQTEALGPVLTGLFFTLFAVSAIVVQLLWPPLLLPLLKKPYRGCLWGLLLMGLSMVIIPAAAKPFVLFTAMGFFGAGFGMSFQGMLGMVVEGSEPAWRGKAIGLFFVAYSLGAALIPPLGGLLWYAWPAASPFFLAAAAALLSLWAGLKAAQAHACCYGGKKQAEV